jgi:cytidylate kinase
MVKIAIDGPAGAGKSTIAKMLSKELSFQYVDTGAMYRGSAYLLKFYNISINVLQDLLKEASFDFINYNCNNKLLIIFKDKKFVLDKELRTPEISEIAGKISKYESIRKIFVRKQKEVANRRSSVIEGRDIATAVSPDATIKIFLTASIEERAKRRFNEWKKMGINVTYEEVLKSIKERDEIDRTRECSPLVKVPDAILLDTTDLNINQVVEKIKTLLRERNIA